MPISSHAPRRKLAGPLLVGVTALFAFGCGNGDGGEADLPANDPELVAQASEKIERAAEESANRVRDRHIPGPKEMKLVCLTPEQARAKNVPPEFIQCHVEAFSTPSKKRPERIYIESEDWRVPVEDGTVGEPVIVDGYRIRDFLRRDHRLGCTVGEMHPVRCKTGFTAE